MTEIERKALVERLRAGVPCCDPDAGNGEGSFFVEDADETMHEAADRIEALSAENERLIKAGDGDVGLIHWQGERIEQLEAALREIARLRTDLRGDFSLGSKQSDIARAALGETK